MARTSPTDEDHGVLTALGPGGPGGDRAPVADLFEGGAAPRDRCRCSPVTGLPNAIMQDLRYEYGRDAGRAAAGGRPVPTDWTRCPATAAPAPPGWRPGRATGRATASNSSRSSRRRCRRRRSRSPGPLPSASERTQPSRRTERTVVIRPQRTYPGPECSGQLPPGRGSRAGGRRRPGPAGRCWRSPGSGTVTSTTRHPVVVEAGSAGPTPGRLTTTRVASRWISSWRSQVASSPATSQPTIRNSSSSGPAWCSSARVSAV